MLAPPLSHRTPPWSAQARATTMDPSGGHSGDHSTVQPFERIEPHSPLVRLFSPKFTDIWSIGLAAIAFAIALTAIAFWGEVSSETRKILLGAVVGIVSGTAAKCYDLANKRAGTIDMIASDIISIGRVLSAAG